MQIGTLLKLSVAAAIAAIVMKTAAWRLTGSVGLLSDAMESFVNLAAALFALWIVHVARQPPDDEHPFGHGKAEYFSSGFEGLLIAAVAVAIVWASASRLLHPQPLEALGWGLGLSVASSALNGLLAWRMLAASRKHRSIALEADARHLVTDVWTSAGVVLGLLLVALTGWHWLDPVLGIGVALNILREGLGLMRRSVAGLMDTAVEPEVRALIERTLAPFAQPPVRIDHVATRRAGARLFVDVHLHLPAGWSLGRAAVLRQGVEQALTRTVPGLRATIQLLPCGVEPQSGDTP